MARRYAEISLPVASSSDLHTVSRPGRLEPVVSTERDGPEARRCH
jgi:hypothetical protein